MPKVAGDRIRLNLAVTVPVFDRLQRVREMGGSESFTEAVRRALEAYDAILRHVSEGGSVVLRHPDGREEVVRFTTV